MGLFSKKDENMICIHKHVDKDTIIAAIKNGADTYEKVKEATGAGAGICRGLKCKKGIEELIEEYK